MRLAWHSMSPVPAVLVAVGPGLSPVSAAVNVSSSGSEGSARSRLKQPATPVLLFGGCIVRYQSAARLVADVVSGLCC